MAPTDLPSTDDPVPVPHGPHEWHRLLGADELAGRVTTVEVGRRTLCVSSVDGSFGVLDNGRPHQGGPGEGTIEKGWWRCLAELCGACGLSVRVSGELDDALADALAANDPALVHVRTDVRLV